MEEVKFYCGGCGRELMLSNGFYYCQTCLVKFLESQISCRCCHSPMLPYRFTLPVHYLTLNNGVGLVCSNPDCPLYTIQIINKKLILFYGDRKLLIRKGEIYKIAHYSFDTGEGHVAGNFCFRDINRSKLGVYLKSIMDKKFND